jgi:hypothetical protein
MKYKDKIIAIDFDGTCVTHEYPKVGRFIGAQKVLKRLIDEGAKLILWTMRSNNKEDLFNNHLTDAVDWFNENQIPLFGVNENPEQKIWTSSPKAYAHVYIDDAALGIPLVEGLNGDRAYVDWEQVEEMLFGDIQ